MPNLRRDGPGHREPSARDRNSDLHQIVVVGGGAAGLELATKLGDTFGRRREAAVTLVDRTRSHLWKPLLHEVAAGSMDVDEHELDYLAQAHWHHFRYRYGEMVGLDRAKKAGDPRRRPSTRTAGRSRLAAASATTRWLSPSAASSMTSVRRG